MSNEKITPDNVNKVNPAPAPAQPVSIQPQVKDEAPKEKVDQAKGSDQVEKSKEAGQSNQEIKEMLASFQKQLEQANKTIEDLQKQAKGGSFLTPSSGPNDQDRHKSKQERMKANLDKQPKEWIYIPLQGGEKRGEAFLPVILNGYRLNVPCGVRIQVPQQVAKVAMDHLQMTDQALDNKYRLDKAPQSTLDALT